MFPCMPFCVIHNTQFHKEKKEMKYIWHNRDYDIKNIYIQRKTIMYLEKYDYVDTHCVILDVTDILCVTLSIKYQ